MVALPVVGLVMVILETVETAEPTDVMLKYNVPPETPFTVAITDCEGT
jgi:hypothetical protein